MSARGPAFRPAARPRRPGHRPPARCGPSSPATDRARARRSSGARPVRASRRCCATTSRGAATQDDGRAWSPCPPGTATRPSCGRRSRRRWRRPPAGPRSIRRAAPATSSTAGATPTAPPLIAFDNGEQIDGVAVAAESAVLHRDAEVQFVITSRHLPPTVPRRWLLRGDVRAVGPLDLAFTAAECAELYAAAGAPDDAPVGELMRRTRGWTGAVALAARLHSRGGERPRRGLRLVRAVPRRATAGRDGAAGSRPAGAAVPGPGPARAFRARPAGHAGRRGLDRRRGRRRRPAGPQHPGRPARGAPARRPGGAAPAAARAGTARRGLRRGHGAAAGRGRPVRRAAAGARLGPRRAGRRRDHEHWPRLHAERPGDLQAALDELPASVRAGKPRCWSCTASSARSRTATRARCSHSSISPPASSTRRPHRPPDRRLLRLAGARPGEPVRRRAADLRRAAGRPGDAATGRAARGRADRRAARRLDGRAVPDDGQSARGPQPPRRSHRLRPVGRVAHQRADLAERAGAGPRARGPAGPHRFPPRPGRQAGAGAHLGAGDGGRVGRHRARPALPRALPVDRGPGVPRPGPCETQAAPAAGVPRLRRRSDVPAAPGRHGGGRGGRAGPRRARGLARRRGS